MVLVVMRDDDRIDRLRVDAGGRQILLVLAVGAVRFGGLGRAVTGVDGDQLRAGVDDDRVEDQRHRVFRQVRRFERGVDLVLLGVVHERVRQRERPRAVRHDGDLVDADLVAIESGRLLAARGRGGTRRRDDRSRTHGGRGRGGGAREHGATGELGHGFLPSAGPGFARAAC